jgi:hypothetical protein
MLNGELRCYKTDGSYTDVRTLEPIVQYCQGLFFGVVVGRSGKYYGRTFYNTWTPLDKWLKQLI